jgi:hypothetical protein
MYDDRNMNIVYYIHVLTPWYPDHILGRAKHSGPPFVRWPQRCGQVRSYLEWHRLSWHREILVLTGSSLGC